MAVGDESVGFGATIEVNDGNGDTFVVIGKCEIIGVPCQTVGTVQSKRLDLENGVIKKLATLIDGGSFPFRVQHTNEAHVRLRTILRAREEKQWRVTVPDDDSDTTVTVPGILTEAKKDDLDPEKITVINCMVEVSGDEI